MSGTLWGFRATFRAQRWQVHPCPEIQCISPEPSTPNSNTPQLPVYSWVKYILEVNKYKKPKLPTFGFHSISLSTGFTLQTINSTAWGGSVWNLSGRCSNWSLVTSPDLPSSMNFTRTLSRAHVSSFWLISNTWTLQNNSGLRPTQRPKGK